MNKLKWIVMSLLGFVGVVLLVAVVINLPAFDEELLSEVKAIRDIKAKPFTSENAFPAMLAFNGEADKDMKQLTETVRIFLNDKIRQTGLDYLTDEETKALTGALQHQKWRNRYQSCQARKDSGCFANLVKQLEQDPITDGDLSVMLDRYAFLLRYTDFSESSQLEFDTPLPVFGSLTYVKRLYLAHHFLHSDASNFYQKLHQDMRFWRMVLEKSHLLINRMIAIAMITENINAFSYAIKVGHISPDKLSEKPSWSGPLSQAERDMSQVFEFEFKGGIGLMEVIEANDEILWFNFYQPKASLNLYFTKVTRPLMKISAMNVAEYMTYQSSDEAWKDFSLGQSWTPSVLYNPVGKNLITYAAPVYRDYIDRVHDLDGMLRLLNLHIELVLKADQPIADVINQSQWMNPYSAAPFSWDQDKQRLWFECKDLTSTCELKL